MIGYAIDWKCMNFDTMFLAAQYMPVASTISWKKLHPKRFDMPESVSDSGTSEPDFDAGVLKRFR